MSDRKSRSLSGFSYKNVFYQLKDLPYLQVKIEAIPHITAFALAAGQLILHAPEQRIKILFEAKSSVICEIVETISPKDWNFNFLLEWD